MIFSLIGKIFQPQCQILIVVLFTDAQLLSFIWVFWPLATTGHLFAFIIANHDDILFKWYFFFGNLISWVVVALVTWIFIDVADVSRTTLNIFYFLHITFISTVLADIFLHQDTFTIANIRAYVWENLKESILIPWFVGGICGWIGIIVIP